MSTRHFIDSIATALEEDVVNSTHRRDHTPASPDGQRQPFRSPFPDTSFPLLMTLHAAMPDIVLPALDLLDKQLVYRVYHGITLPSDDKAASPNNVHVRGKGKAVHLDTKHDRRSTSQNVTLPLRTQKDQTTREASSSPLSSLASASPSPPSSYSPVPVLHSSAAPTTSQAYSQPAPSPRQPSSTPLSKHKHTSATPALPPDPFTSSLESLRPKPRFGHPTCWLVHDEDDDDEYDIIRLTAWSCTCADFAMDAFGSAEMHGVDETRTGLEAFGRLLKDDAWDTEDGNEHEAENGKEGEVNGEDEQGRIEVMDERDEMDAAEGIVGGQDAGVGGQAGLGDSGNSGTEDEGTGHHDDNDNDSDSSDEEDGGAKLTDDTTEQPTSHSSDTSPTPKSPTLDSTDLAITAQSPTPSPELAQTVSSDLPNEPIPTSTQEDHAGTVAADMIEEMINRVIVDANMEAQIQRMADEMMTFFSDDFNEDEQAGVEDDDARSVTSEWYSDRGSDDGREERNGIPKEPGEETSGEGIKEGVHRIHDMAYSKHVSFGGIAWDGGHVMADNSDIPCCKHLLACFLAAKCGSLLGCYVEDLIVGSAELAGLVAGSW